MDFNESDRDEFRHLIRTATDIICVSAAVVLGLFPIETTRRRDVNRSRVTSNECRAGLRPAAVDEDTSVKTVAAALP